MSLATAYIFVNSDGVRVVPRTTRHSYRLAWPHYLYRIEISQLVEHALNLDSRT